jgi:hypothetical protein
VEESSAVPMPTSTLIPYNQSVVASSGRLARLNLVKGFSKLARSVLRHIRLASKRELKDCLIAAIDHINRHPVIHTWTSKLDRAA